MKKLALLLLGLLLASPAFAVDNTVIVTPGTGVTMRSKDVGSGVESMIHIIGDTTGNPIYGTAGTANANILTVQGIASMTPFLTTTTLNAETTKVIGTTRNVGNVGGVFDAIGQNVAAPANWLQIGCQFQTTPTTITAANGSPFQCDNAANALVNVKVSALPSGAATSANQSTEITSLATLHTDLGTLNTTAGSSTPAGTNTIGNVNGAPNITATDCSGTVTTGGTAQNAFTAQTTLHGFTIMNIDTSEPLWISFTTTAAASGAGSYPLQAATATTFASPGSFTTPTGFGLNHALSVVAATTAHKFTCTWW